MKEHEIRNRDAFNTYLALVQRDAEVLVRDVSAFSEVSCPACGTDEHDSGFVKGGFHYVQCSECETLFVNPRPHFDRLAEIYADSPSTRFWVEEFFKPMAEARREKIFKPRAVFVAEQFPSLAQGRVGDIGAGFGLFLEELRTIWPSVNGTAIEPSADMAAILRGKGIEVIEAMLEDISSDAPRFDLLTAFELFEHLHDPLSFLESARALLDPGGFLYLTTLSGRGFDIQLLWEQSKSVSPPHHLNFINPTSMRRVLERAGLEVVAIDTPGQLDWDIVEGAARHEAGDPGRFFRTVARHASESAKAELQEWIRRSGFSSHLRVIARRPA